MPAPSFQAFPMPPPVIHPVCKITAVILLKGAQLPNIPGNISQLNKFDYYGVLVDALKIPKTSHLKTLRISACQVLITAMCQPSELFDALNLNP